MQVFTLIQIFKKQKKKKKKKNDHKEPAEHYENMSIKIYWEVYHQKMKTFRWKILVVFIQISTQNIGCEYLLEPPQSIFLSRNK